MRIKRLKLSGFKSFVEPTEFKIRDGLTGIVGPNGCGKSNLLEALRWVMGESSAKSMRGGGMEDVIFAGTASRPPREFAEVTLLAERESHENAPAFFANDSDEELEVTRRIERGAGSAYRANGADVRAKDVALIFADAATGAHSPALVSQGRIGSIISAKPAERRQMLEEAAGISGLHVRRKDAEQKLRATERNLEKLSIMLEDMAARASQLKRQARQAERYKKLSGEITQSEGRLIFVKWRAAKAAADAAKALSAQAAGEVETATTQREELSRQQAQATQQLASDRAAAMAARDAASDVNTQIITLTSEQERIRQRSADLDRQNAQLNEDSAREGKLTHDAAEALEKLKAESEKLAASIAAQEEKRPQLERAHEKVEHSLRESELSLAKAHAEQAKAEAELRVARSAADQAATRLARSNQEAERLAAEKASLGDADEYQQKLNTAQSQKAGLEQALKGADATLQALNSRRQDRLNDRDKAQNILAGARADLAALQSEGDALSRATQEHSSDKAIDQINVTRGYERALAAALGDDANAAVGTQGGRRWSGAPANSSGKGGERLSNYVEAPAQLAARLAMIIVADADDGRTLEPGERLVTPDGRMRRWDGFVSEEDGATQAEALIRSNRLKDIAAQMPAAEEAVEKSAKQLSDAEAAVLKLQDEQQAAESVRQSSDAALRQALRDVDQAADALKRLQSASAALDERIAQSGQDMKAAEDEAKEAESALNLLPEAGAQDAVVEKLEQEGEALRQNMMRAQAELSSLDQSLGQERERRAVAEADIRSWRDRAGEAAKRISDMKQRAGEIAEERAELSDKPDMLARQLSDLESKKESLSEKLATLQTAEQESETALKELETKLAGAAEALSSAREARAGAAARAENEEARRAEMGRIAGEKFECPPPQLPEKLSFGEDDLGDSEAESSRLDQLQASRERIGPVNLIAADELTALEEERATGLTESEELTLAINQLRGSIGSLNREGRQRLLEAFEAVDGHFRRLFATLFNGGQAHLALIDRDDPLEAGLEIFAQPPGKKLQSLTLLSGGEQALTAIALIFALFLTNPAPICVLDEVDAPLDDANIERFCNLLDAMNRDTDTRYMIVTHNAVTMSRMDRLFGVTMIEQGVSRLVSVDLGAAEELLAAE